MFQIYGIDPTPDGVLQYRDWTESVLPEDLRESEEILQDTVRRAGSSRREFRIRRRSDGECRHIEAVETVRTNENGEAEWIVGTNLDVTSRKQAEEALRESDERYRAATAAVSDVIWTNNADGFMEGEQRGWEDFTGQSREKYQGYGWSKAVHPEDAQPTIEAWARAVAEKRTFVFEHRVRRRDGEWRVCSVRAVPILNADGKIREWVGVHEDITERKQADLELANREAHLRRVINNQLGLVGVIDRDGILLEVDERSLAIAKARREQVIGKHFADAPWWNYDPEVARQMRDAMRRAMAGEVVRYDVSLFAHGAEGVMITFMIAPVFGDDGKVEYLIPSGVDIRERYASEQKLRQLASDLSESDRRKTEFVAMLAHELRNPLAPIRNVLPLLKANSHDKDFVTTASAIIERQVKQMVRLVDDLLDVSRVSRGKIELRKERVDLPSIVRQAQEAASPLIESMNHELTVTLPSQPVEVNGDPVRLIQVVSNLLTNACKFTDHGGRIWLTVERGGDGAGERVAEQAVIRVRDNGIGISAGDLPRLFQIFMQADTSLDRPSAGLGIGLALVKNLVEMHGGTVEVYSDGIGKGSEFVVRLPTLPAEPQARPAEPTLTNPAQNATDPKRSLRILVVDDNRDSAKSMALLLKSEGHLTHIAYDGLQAVEAASTFRPDVVLMDIGLPTLNGYEACRRIREQPAGNTIRMLALTGWGQNEDRQKTAEAGFDAHLVKPVDFQELLKLLTK